MPTKRVLLAEDDRPLANIVRFNLESNGFVVTLAYDGASAIEHANVSEFTAAIIDYQLPSADGLEIIRSIRGSELNANLPVVMYTANITSLDTTAVIKELQLMAIVAKPFSPIELVRLLTEHIHRASLRQPHLSESQFLC